MSMTLEDINKRISQIKDELHDLVVSNDDRDTINELKDELGALRDMKRAMFMAEIKDTNK